MKKISFLKTFKLILLICMSITLTNCSSSSDDDNKSSTDAKFNPADFALTITNKEVTSVGLRISYDLKNNSKVSYSDYKQGVFSIKFSVKATDGTVFQNVRGIDYLESGVMSSNFTYLDYSITKTLDLSTFTAVIVSN